MGSSERGTRRYKAMVSAFKADCRTARPGGLPCARCGQPIKYDAELWDPARFQAGHIKSFEDYPDLRLDPSNLQPEHALCNQEAGKRAVVPGIGTTSEEW